MLSALVLFAAGPIAQIEIDARVQSPISPYIYGTNYPNNWIYDWLKEWDAHHGPFTFARASGNRFTAYNWETNYSNAGADYFHQNDNYLGASEEPGWTVRHFLHAVQGKGKAALVTVPIQGYVSADRDTERGGVRDVGQSPDHLNTRLLRSFARKPGGKLSFPPDVTDRAVYQDEFVTWVERTKAPNTPVFYTLDNEPDFWYHTHPRIQPQKPTYADFFARSIEYAGMIKSIAPKALVFGPVNYGWNGMRSFQEASDANGRFFVTAYLDAMREASRKAGRRLLDVYDFHLYPEARGGGVRIIYNQAPDTPETEDARIQAPRSLWDPTYVEDSWVPGSLGGEPFKLLPRMKEWISKHYPGTKIAITEYEYGGRDKISGALAQADALGAFGRHSVFAANHWGVDHEEKPVFAAFQAFTDYDRQGSAFGDRGLAVRGEKPALHSVYAALDSRQRGRMTLVTINKSRSAQPFEIGLKGFRARSLRTFVVTDGQYEKPQPLPDAELSDGKLTFTAPPLSIATLELRSR